MTRLPDGPRAIWRQDLTPGPECLAPERVGAELTPDEQSHVRGCARCQTERALWDAFNQSSPSGVASDETAVQFIAAQTRRRLAQEFEIPHRVAPARSVSRRWLAVAAGVLLAISGTLLMQTSVPDIGPAPQQSDVYRSGNLDLQHPNGDLDAPPIEFAWEAVAGATRYEVRLMEVDGNILWSATSEAPRVAAPPTITQWAAPMKTLVWEVTAHNSAGSVLARSAATRFRNRGSVLPREQQKESS